MKKNKKQKKNKRLFSKALFKQSCKANGTMWLIITLAVCFMLSCVMLISGTSSISSVKVGIEDTIIDETIKAGIKKTSIELYGSTITGEEIFDRAFVEKFNEINTYDNYLQIKAVTNVATNNATKLVKEEVTKLVTEEVTNRLTQQVKDSVTEMVTEEVTKRITVEVTERVTQMITDEVTSRLTNEVKEKVTEMVTEEVTKRLTQEVNDYVTSKSSQIASEVSQAVAADMATEQAQQMIAEKMANGMDQEAATNEVIAYYTNIEKQRITNNYIAEAQKAIVTEQHKSEVTNNVLAEKQEEFTIEAQKAIITDAHKAEVTNTVVNEKKNEFTAKAQKEIVTDAHKAEVANKVLAEKQNEFTEAAKKSVITDSNKNKVSSEVLAANQAKYTNIAKNTLSEKLDNISEEAKEEVTQLITDFYIAPCYEYAVEAVSEKYPEDKEETAYGAAMVAINPDHKVDDKYIENGENVPDEYIEKLIDYIQDDILSWEKGNPTITCEEYIKTADRDDFRSVRGYDAISMLVASQINDSEYKQEMLDKLSEYDVDEKKYDSMGFDYNNSKKLAYEASLEFQQKMNYEISLLSDEIKGDDDKYVVAKQEIYDDLFASVSGSFLDCLPEDVTDGIKELGTMDLYGLIVGSIFYKMAGLLLPIIYIIMTSNNLIASQVDTGSMAYVLSTSTRREEVTFTQGVYLIGSTLLMFVFTTITSCVCYKIADVSTNLSYAKLVLINLGAFVTMFAVSGINFFTSCRFDRSKRAMALGGGISMFFLVATMLGLFGSPVIPGVVRISTLNYFNYVSIISLFDVISILDQSSVWIYKLFILVGIGCIGYIAGSIHFKNKDLPL